MITLQHTASGHEIQIRNERDLARGVSPRTVEGWEQGRKSLIIGGD